MVRLVRGDEGGASCYVKRAGQHMCIGVDIFEAAQAIEWSYQVMTMSTTTRQIICRRITRDRDRNWSPRPAAVTFSLRFLRYFRSCFCYPSLALVAEIDCFFPISTVTVRPATVQGLAPSRPVPYRYGWSTVDRLELGERSVSYALPLEILTMIAFDRRVHCSLYPSSGLQRYQLHSGSFDSPFDPTPSVYFYFAF